MIRPLHTNLPFKITYNHSYNKALAVHSVAGGLSSTYIIISVAKLVNMSSADRSLLPARWSWPTMTEIFGSDGLPFGEDPLDIASAERPNVPPAPTKKQAKGKGKGPHKRQILEAIPRAEREVVRATHYRAGGNSG